MIIHIRVRVSNAYEFDCESELRIHVLKSTATLADLTPGLVLPGLVCFAETQYDLRVKRVSTQPNNIWTEKG